MKPDLVSLNEVCEHQARAIASAARPAYQYRHVTTFEPTISGRNCRFGNAVLARPPFAFVESNAVDLTGGQEPRATLCGRLRHGRNQSLVLCSTHFTPAFEKPGAASRQMSEASSWARSFAGSDPLLLAGDFNLTPEHLPTSGALRDIDYRQRPTRKSRKIDYILISEGVERLRSALVDVSFSDHRALLGYVRLSELQAGSHDG